MDEAQSPADRRHDLKIRALALRRRIAGYNQQTAALLATLRGERRRDRAPLHAELLAVAAEMAAITHTTHDAAAEELGIPEAEIASAVESTSRYAGRTTPRVPRSRTGGTARDQRNGADG